MIAMGIFVYMLRCSDGSFYVGSATGDDLSPASISAMLAITQVTHSRGVRLFLSGPNILIGSQMALRLNDKSKVGAAPRRKH